MITLFDECVYALKPFVKILPLQQRGNYSRIVSNNFPIQRNGAVNWKMVDKKKDIFENNEILPYLQKTFDNFDEKIFILWDGIHLPIVESNLSSVINKIDDVTSVGFDTWIISPQHRYVIEFYHENEIHIGFY